MFEASRRLRMLWLKSGMPARIVAHTPSASSLPSGCGLTPTNRKSSARYAAAFASSPPEISLSSFVTMSIALMVCLLVLAVSVVAPSPRKPLWRPRPPGGMIEAALRPCDSARVLDWNDFRYFLAIARAGTLAGAARELSVEHTTVGRRLAALEGALGARLFLRGPDGLAATSAGRAVLPLAEEIAARVEAIERRVSGDDGRIEGTVRISTSEAVSGYLVRAFTALRERLPGLLVEILSGNHAAD